MATFNKFNIVTLDLAEGEHDWGSTGGDTLQIYMTNAAPSASLDAVKTDLAEIATGNGYTGPISVTITTSEVSGTQYQLTLADISAAITATGAVTDFQYIVLFNSTATTKTSPLIGWWDYGSTVSMVNGEEFDVDFGAPSVTID